MKNNVLVCLKIILLLLLVAIYYNTFIWMVERWALPGSYYSHGYLVPFVSGFLVWKVRNCFNETRNSSSKLGIILFSTGILIHIVSALMRVHFTSGFSFVIVLVGIIFYLYGAEVGKKLIFPIAFLLTMVPLPLSAIAGLTLKLKLFAADCAVKVIELLNIPAIQDGSRIIFSDCSILVADVCSGLKSLIALISFGALFAYMFGVSKYMKPVLFMSSVPAALIANIIRIVIVSLVANKFGTSTADSLHDIAGIFIFVIAFVLLFSLGIGLQAIDKLFFSTRNYWKKC